MVCIATRTSADRIRANNSPAGITGLGLTWELMRERHQGSCNTALDFSYLVLLPNISTAQNFEDLLTNLFCDWYWLPRDMDRCLRSSLSALLLSSRLLVAFEIRSKFLVRSIEALSPQILSSLEAGRSPSLDRSPHVSYRWLTPMSTHVSQFPFDGLNPVSQATEKMADDEINISNHDNQDMDNEDFADDDIEDVDLKQGEDEQDDQLILLTQRKAALKDRITPSRPNTNV
ncbi:unnamed protein product [Strongylus vulgaris]|uniref:Uncharacterized protein n=1 Tax=Strongylus vulgaris TaxID=40348 RepID=A0A3P7IPF1_STRVU|nr:unnamed protein product [Strongylus vulgaris]